MRTLLGTGLLGAMLATTPAAAQDFEGPWVAVAPGVVTIGLNIGGGVSYEYGISGGYLLPVGNLTLSVGAYFEHVVDGGGQLMSVGPEAKLGAVVAGDKLFVYGLVGLGFGFVIAGQVGIFTFAPNLGGGAEYRLTNWLGVGGELEVDLFIGDGGGVPVLLDIQAVATFHF